MCCWVILAFAFAPRATLFLMWLFTDRISAAFGGRILPLLGFFFMPWTTLTYTLASPHGLNAFEIVLLIIAAGVDLGIWGGGAKHRSWEP
jgi:hypothetical protein